MRPSRNGVNALWRILQAEETVDAPHINLALDAALGEAGMNGKVDGRTIRGLLGVGVEGLMRKVAAGPPVPTVQGRGALYTIVGLQQTFHHAGCQHRPPLLGRS